MTGKEVKVFLYICIISPAKKNLQNLFLLSFPHIFHFYQELKKLSKKKKTNEENGSRNES